MKAREPKFKVGHRIMWSSQSAGIWKQKIGDVIAIIRKNESIKSHLVRLGYDTLRCSVHAADSALIDRYLVDVELMPGGSNSRNNQIYAPDFARAEKKGKILS